MAIIYAPSVLKSMNEICKVFGVGAKQVRGWVDAGAPIAVEGEGFKTRYSTEMVRLQVWREEQSRKWSEANREIETSGVSKNV